MNRGAPQTKRGCAGRGLCRGAPAPVGSEKRDLSLFSFDCFHAKEWSLVYRPQHTPRLLQRDTLALQKRVPRGPVVGSGRRPRRVVAFAARRAANLWKGLFLLHLHILFGALILGFGLLLAALLGLVSAAASGLTRGTSGRPFGLGLSWHCSAPLR